MSVLQVCSPPFVLIGRFVVRLVIERMIERRRRILRVVGFEGSCYKGQRLNYRED